MMMITIIIIIIIKGCCIEIKLGCNGLETKI